VRRGAARVATGTPTAPVPALVVGLHRWRTIGEVQPLQQLDLVGLVRLLSIEFWRLLAARGWPAEDANDIVAV
jgi:hypothetical protein